MQVFARTTARVTCRFKTSEFLLKHLSLYRMVSTIGVNAARDRLVSTFLASTNGRMDPKKGKLVYGRAEVN